MAFEFNRNQQDASYTSSVAIAQAGANSATFDLEQLLGGDIEKVVVEISAPAASGITSGKVLTYTFKDSADGVTFTALDPAVATTQTAGGSGTTAKSVRFRLSPACRQYVRVEQTSDATAGTFSGSFVTKLLF
jgi:hypothetical protein